MTVTGLWLRRSGQAWKTKSAVTAAAVGFVLFAMGFVVLQRWDPVALIAFLLVPALGVANLVLPMWVRCPVCGLQLDTCSIARKLSRGDRLKWLEALDVCPICGDDGRATAESRARWLNSGVKPEAPYWSRSRILLAILATILVAGGGYAIGALYEVKP